MYSTGSTPLLRFKQIDPEEPKQRGYNTSLLSLLNKPSLAWVRLAFSLTGAIHSISNSQTYINYRPPFYGLNMR